MDDRNEIVDDRVAETTTEASSSEHERTHEAVSRDTGADGRQSTTGRTLAGQTADRSGERIGRYRLISPLGAGGMGVVYLAEQSGPIEREVALKLTGASTGSEQLLRRFEDERQALALMNHPSIAQVYDAGCSTGGEPFFVMEYVAGEPITTHCDSQKLGVRQRLELVIAVCGGVHHAHQKGVIHRDLKPSNVLIEATGEPLPKIIDFGIAKALEGSSVDHNRLTRDGGILGTPGYMAPERIRRPDDVDTRADIYSLGVLLYMLLTGTQPHRAGADNHVGIADEVLTRDAERPSARLTSLEEQRLARVAAARSTDAAGLCRSLKGDLDWITLKALARDRDRRYGSAAELAADLRHHLDDEPVLASPPSSMYRFRRFVRRHSVGVVSVVVATLALLCGITATSLQAARAGRQAARANQEAEAAKQVTDYLKSIFDVSDLSVARGETITAREILDRGARRIDQELATRPLIRAHLQHVMGEVYSELALYDDAETLLRSAITLRDERLGPDHVDTLTSRWLHGSVLRRMGRTADAEQLELEVLAVLERQPEADTRLLANTVNQLAIIHAERADFEEAEPLFVRAVKLWQAGGDLERAADGHGNLASLYGLMTRHDDAETAMRSALAIHRELYGETDPRAGRDLLMLATIRHQRVSISTSADAGSDLAEIESLCRQALDILEPAYGPQHPLTAAGFDQLGRLLIAQGRAQEALPFVENAHRAFVDAQGPNGASVAPVEYVLGYAHHSLGNYTVAEHHFERSVAIYLEVKGPDYLYLAQPYYMLAELAMLDGRLERAEPLLRRCLELLVPIRDADHPEILRARSALTALLRETGRTEEADQLDRDEQPAPSEVDATPML